MLGGSFSSPDRGTFPAGDQNPNYDPWLHHVWRTRRARVGAEIQEVRLLACIFSDGRMIYSASSEIRGPWDVAVPQVR